MQNSHFTTVLGVRRARSDERVVSRRCQPNPPDIKRRKKFLKKSWSAAILSSHPQQLFPAAIRSSHSHQPLLSSSSQQPFSPAILITSLWSGVGGQPFSSRRCGQLVVKQPFVAAILTSHFSAALLGSQSHQLFASRRGGQGLVPFSSRRCGQGLVVSHSHHVAVVRGWWSAIVTSCCCGQGLMVSYCLIMLTTSPLQVELFPNMTGTLSSCRLYSSEIKVGSFFYPPTATHPRNLVSNIRHFEWWFTYCNGLIARNKGGMAMENMSLLHAAGPVF